MRNHEKLVLIKSNYGLYQKYPNTALDKMVSAGYFDSTQRVGVLLVENGQASDGRLGHLMRHGYLAVNYM